MSSLEKVQKTLSSSSNASYLFAIFHFQKRNIMSNNKSFMATSRRRRFFKSFCSWVDDKDQQSIIELCKMHPPIWQITLYLLWFCVKFGAGHHPRRWGHRGWPAGLHHYLPDTPFCRPTVRKKEGPLHERNTDCRHKISFFSNLLKNLQEF